MTDSDTKFLPVPAFAGGTKVISRTPVVGTPGRAYTEAFIPGEEKIGDGEIRVTISPQVIPAVFAELGMVYDGPVVQTQDLTVFNITKEAVIARQAKVVEQLPPIAGEQRMAFKPVAVKPPDWWAEALIPLD
jgi:hypothetical protein